MERINQHRCGTEKHNKKVVSFKISSIFPNKRESLNLLLAWNIYYLIIFFLIKRYLASFSKCLDKINNAILSLIPLFNSCFCLLQVILVSFYGCAIKFTTLIKLISLIKGNKKRKILRK